MLLTLVYHNIMVASPEEELGLEKKFSKKWPKIFSLRFLGDKLLIGVHGLRQKDRGPPVLPEPWGAGPKKLILGGENWGRNF